MKRILSFTLLTVLLPCSSLHAQELLPGARNVNVFFEEGRFAGWPANNGMWGWGDEMVVGFTLGWFKAKADGHPIDPDRKSVQRLARSLDGGETWSIETPSYLDADDKEAEPTELKRAINFTHPDFAFLMRMTNSKEGHSRFYYSYDRCKTWEGPFKLPDFGRPGIMARNDYVVNGKRDCHIFVTSAKDGGGEGWPLCARTTDGGKSWQLQGMIGEQPGPGGYAIMPATVRIDDNSLLSVIRRRSDESVQPKTWWIETFLSPDNGRRWYLLEHPNVDNAGNPPSMITLADGHIALAYGFRSAPYGMRAMVSVDKGQTWSKEVILRADGGEWDLGYPRTVQRSDGKCVTVYYFNDGTRNERYIEATIWDPATVMTPSP